MDQENGIAIINQGAKIDPAIINTANMVPDDIPIGGGSKFNFSQYPSENDAPPPKKPVARKPLKAAAKKEEAPIQNKEEAPLKNGQPLDEIQVGGNDGTNTFDDKPIPKGNFSLSEFPEGEAPVVQETNYTMTQMLKSKANKLKLSGMEALHKMLEEDPTNSELSDVNIASLLKETVPANLEKSLQCMQAWMKCERTWGEDEARNLIQNAYINGKPNTKKLAMEIADQMYEQKADVMEMVILTGFKNKAGKIIAGYNALLNELIAIYGVKRLKYLKPYFSEVLRVISTEKLPAVKTEGMNTLKEAYKWMTKEVVEPMLKDIKQLQKKELDTFWEGYDKTIVMKAPKDIPDQPGKNKGKKVDAYDLSEAVDIFKKFNEKWSDSVINAPKWNEKTKLMEDFVKEASVPKLANTDFRPATEVIRRLINDSNFNVQLWVLRMIGVLSKGLRRPFAPIVKSNFSNVIGKFRDKKTQMVEQTFKTLNDISYCLVIEDVLEDVKEGLADKAPTMRVNLLNWIGKYVEQKVEQKGGQVPEKIKDTIKQLFPLFEKLLTESVAEVRETAVKCVGKLELYFGEDFFAPIKAKANKGLIGKIGNSYEGQKQKKKQNPVTKKGGDDLSKSQVNLKPPKPGDSKISSKPSVEKEKEKEKEQPSKPLECFDQPLYDQSLQSLIALGFPQQEIKKLTSSGAAERGTILAYMRENPYENFNDVLRVIRKAYKDWKEVNLQMNKDLISYLEERQGDIGKPEAYVILPYIIEKIGDNKFAQSLTRLTINICKSVSPRYVSGHIIRCAKGVQKRPKVNSDACTLLVKVVEAVSISNLNAKQLIEFAKETYGGQFSKKGGAELLACLYSYLGEGLKSSLDEVTIKGMDGEFKSIKPLTEVQKKPSIEFEGEAALECKTIPNKKVESKSDGKVRDLSNDVLKLMPNMNDNGNWQKRKDAAESLSILLDQGGKVSFGNTTNDLLATLKVRVNDPNKQLIKVFIHLTGQVLCSLAEKDLKANARNFIISMIEGLNDKNDLNRKEINTTLGRLGETIGKQAILSTLGPSLQGDRDGRLEVLNLILVLQDGIPKADIRDYVKGLTSCLSDKNKDIRAGAEKVFEKVYQKLGIESFRAIAKNQKPAVATDLNNFLDRFDRNNASSSSFHSKGPSPSKPENKSIIKEKEKSRLTMTLPQQPPQFQQQPPLSAKKRSLSRNNTQKSFLEGQDDAHAVTVGNFLVNKRPSYVQGSDIFADLKILASERGERQGSEQQYCWRLDEIKQIQEEAIRNQIEKLINHDLSKKLLSFDYKRVIEGVIQVIKISKDLTYQSHIRELYDVFLKWILLRLWGGQPGMITTIELVAPILSIMEKKKLALTDFEVQLVIAVIRQYLISALMVGFKFSESLYNILKCLVALSSGEKVLRKVLHQFSVELSTHHKHLRKDSCQFYREALSKLIKNQLIDYVGNSDTLEEVSRIKQLKEDQEFVEMLFRRLHENVLTNFGFKRAPALSSSNLQQAPTLSNASFTSDREINKERSLDRGSLPARNDPKSSTMVELRPSNAPPPANRKVPNNSQLPSAVERPPIQKSSFNEESVKQSNMNQPQVAKNIYETHYLNISAYPAPHPASPLGKNLSKLMPPSEQTINFFNTLFQENSEKIVNELSLNAKFIFGSILRSVHDIIAARRQYSPDKLVAQITLLQNCIKCTHVVHAVGDLLGFGTSFALTQLVYEDQHKAEICEELRSRNIEYKSDNFIKAINGVMLRLLENANPQDIVNTLLQLLSIHTQQQHPSPKTISLIVKCLGRVSASFTKELLRLEAVKTFILRSNDYLAAIQYDTALEQINLALREQNRERIRPQDSAANSIKTIITQVCTAIGSDIWDVYEKAMIQSRYPDRYIASYLMSLNIRVPDRPRVRSQAKQNEELKKINELLSKTKSYDTGIVQLRKYVEKHPEFSPIQYFTSLNYDQKFIAMVVKSLEGTSRLTPAKEKEEQGPENIQDKIQKLKKKFQELQPENLPQVVNSNARRQVGEEEQRQERAQEIKRRIEEMKNKMTNAVNRGRP